MDRISSFLEGRWVGGDAAAATLLTPATEEPLAAIAAPPASVAPALEHARRRGGPALAALSFAQRGEALKALSRAVHARRDELLAVAVANGGNTRGDAKFDIDGASGTLAHYAELGAALGAGRLLPDGDSVQLGRSPRWHGRHVLAPRAGVAVLLNAFNFPAWGIAEKAACALLAGVPVLARPATPTALVAHHFFRVLLEANALPDGALQLLVGPPGDLLEALGGSDVLAFTGSSGTAAELRARVAPGVRVNVEADSLNAAVIGPDVEPGSPTWDLVLADIARDMTQKAGQKCTAIRRVLAPASLLGRLGADLGERLAGVRVGDPALDAVGMGPLATGGQRDDVRAGIAALAAAGRAVFGGDGSVSPVGPPPGKGFFVGPVLLEARDPGAGVIHEREVFGPVATLLAAEDPAAAAALVARGGGGLVSSVYSDDRAFLGAMVAALAPHHGRLYLGSAKVAGQTAGPGTALPQVLHGGPGRAGDGAELGGLAGLRLYQQRTALQGDKGILDALVA
jgi:3,4-dehydroadipyl-CoA semialdehyde dehydrogenase